MMQNRRVGLVGGLGPESTIDYYRRLIAEWEQVHPGSSPPILIDSLDVQVGLRLVQHDRSALVDYLAQSLERLTRGGADFLAMTANTAHVVFDDLLPLVRVPLLSIVEPVALEAASRQFRRLGLLGTRFTMEASFYPTLCARHGIEVVAPSPSEREQIHTRYVGELLKGDFRDSTRAEVIGIAERLRDEHAVDAFVLAGTELPLLLSASRLAGLPVLDSTQLHVREIVRRLLADRV